MHKTIYFCLIALYNNLYSETKVKVMINFKNPKAVIWTKVNGDTTAGMLTNDLQLVPEEFRPTKPTPKIRGYRHLFCLNRNRWISLYLKNIQAIV